MRGNKSSHVILIWISIILGLISLAVSLIRCEPFVLTDSFVEWLTSILIAILSIGIATVLAFQIYNSMTIDKRVEKATQNAIDKTDAALRIDSVRSTCAVMYQVYGVSLKMNISLKDYKTAFLNLGTMGEYAQVLKDDPQIPFDFANIVMGVDAIIGSEISIDLIISLYNDTNIALSLLPASHKYVPSLLELKNKLQSKIQESKPKDSERDNNH